MNTYPTLGPIAQCRVSLPAVRGVPKGRRDDYAMEEEMTVPGEKAVPVGLRPATHLEMRCVLGESNDPVGGRAGLWRVRFPPVLVRTARRLPVEALG